MPVFRTPDKPIEETMSRKEKELWAACGQDALKSTKAEEQSLDAKLPPDVLKEKVLEPALKETMSRKEKELWAACGQEKTIKQKKRLVLFASQSVLEAVALAIGADFNGKELQELREVNGRQNHLLERAEEEAENREVKAILEREESPIRGAERDPDEIKMSPSRLSDASTAAGSDEELEAAERRCRQLEEELQELREVNGRQNHLLERAEEELQELREVNARQNHLLERAEEAAMAAKRLEAAAKVAAERHAAETAVLREQLDVCHREAASKIQELQELREVNGQQNDQGERAKEEAENREVKAILEREESPSRGAERDLEPSPSEGETFFSVWIAARADIVRLKAIQYEDEKRRAYKKLLLKYHPDKNRHNREVMTRVYQEVFG